MMKYKHLFFDLDDTVTRSRSVLSPEMEKTLKSLISKGVDIIIVSGATVAQGRKQMNDLPCIYLGQNGNHAYDGKSKKDVWKSLLDSEAKSLIWKHILSIPRTWEVSNEDDLVQDRGSQISYSLLGHNEDLEKKEAFDPDFSKRKKILEEYPLESDIVEVKMGGTTCLDYFQKGKHKGFNVAKLIEQEGWRKEECVYVGDALFPGGNDSTVMGVIDTKPVAGPHETLEFVQSVDSQE